MNKQILDKLILRATLAALCGSAAVALPALAQQTTAATAAAAQATPADQANVQSRAATKRAVPPLDSRRCIRDTGSHIPPPKGQCLPVAGNSYSAQDIQRTGQPDVGRALQMLDPSIRAHGH
jgi:hypothetical protein